MVQELNSRPPIPLRIVLLKAARISIFADFPGPCFRRLDGRVQILINTHGGDVLENPFLVGSAHVLPIIPADRIHLARRLRDLHGPFNHQAHFTSFPGSAVIHGDPRHHVGFASDGGGLSRKRGDELMVSE